MEAAVEFADKYYDEQRGLMWDREYRGHRIRESAWLAQCYLQLGIMPERANTLVRNVLDAQVQAGEHAGNFLWNAGDKVLTDQNCAPFIVPSLTFIMSNYWSQLDSDVKNRLPLALEKARWELVSLEKHIPVWYGNIFLSIIAGLVMLGDDETAFKWTRTYYEFTCRFGINEYAAWNYSAVQVGALQNAYCHTRSDQLRQLLGELLEYHWFDIVHQLHVPTLMIASPTSRARGRTGLVPSRTLMSLYYLYFELGQPCSDGMPRVELLLSDYQPPEQIYQVLDAKLSGRPFAYQARYGRVDVVSYQTESFSLAVQTGRRSSLGITNTTKPLLSSEKQEITIQINVKNECSTKGIAFRVHDARGDFDRYWVSAVQSKGLALVSYNFAPRDKSVKEISSWAVLGSREALGGLLINGTAWTGSEIAFGTQSVLAYELGACFIGIRFLENDAIELAGHQSVSLEKPLVIRERDGEVLLKNYLFADSEGRLVNEDCRRLGYVILVQERAPHDKLLDFYQRAAEISITQKLVGSIHTVEVGYAAENLVLIEDLASNTVLSRQVNGREFDNSYLLKSDYVEFLVDPDSLEVAPDDAVVQGRISSLAVNIPRSGTWQVLVHVQPCNSSAGADGDRLEVWWNQSRSRAFAVNWTPKDDQDPWITIPGCWLHQGTHILRIKKPLDWALKRILLKPLI